ncbi:hypothetical protein CRM75_05015 [Enterococcus faecium]|nr:hypothetical protein CRM75_05015 [Enterococcus faecium]
MVESILREKLASKEIVFSDQEVYWLVKNIGNPKAEIRDKLVYSLLVRGLSENLMTKDQYRFLVKQTIDNELLFYHINQGLPATLTRTFTALLICLLVDVDGKKDSSYYGLLTESERDYYFHSAVKYLESEQDFTGYSDNYGWVHAFAHGADLLLYCILHEKFPDNLKTKALEVISGVFKRLPEAFVDEEERRLATVIDENILTGHLKSETVATWINQQSFPLHERIDFSRLATFKNFLAAIYFHLLPTEKLEGPLKNSLLNYLQDY